MTGLVALDILPAPVLLTIKAMTLSLFLRDYVYIPLGGNRYGEARRYVNIMPLRNGEGSSSRSRIRSTGGARTNWPSGAR